MISSQNIHGMLFDQNIHGMLFVMILEDFIFMYRYIFFLSDERELTCEIVSSDLNIEVFDFESDSFANKENNIERTVQCNIFIIYIFIYCDILIFAYNKENINFFAGSSNTSSLHDAGTSEVRSNISRDNIKRKCITRKRKGSPDLCPTEETLKIERLKRIMEEDKEIAQVRLQHEKTIARLKEDHLKELNRIEMHHRKEIHKIEMDINKVKLKITEKENIRPL